MLVRFRAAEGCEPQQTFIWDSVWLNNISGAGGYADWILAGANDDPQQRGGLRARMQLLTSIVLQLFTDQRLPESMQPPGRPGDDPRGWWGDSLKLDGEPNAPIGSLLWTLERLPLNEAARLAPDICKAALQVILDQGAAERFDVTAAADPQGFLGVIVKAFDHLGRSLLDQNFEVLWQQIANPAPMTFVR